MSNVEENQTGPMSRIDMRGAPTWDSSKKDEWSDFSTNFESHVELSDGGELVSILSDRVNSNSQDVLPSSASISTGDEDAEVQISTPEGRFHVLSLALQKLGLQLYHVIKLKIKGPARQTLCIARRVVCKQWPFCTQSMERRIDCVNPLSLPNCAICCMMAIKSGLRIQRSL